MPALDEIERAHSLVGGTGPGRRYATQQINYAYALLLSSQFQGYCRDLHSECIDFLVDKVSPPAMPAVKAVLRTAFIQNRLLDRGNIGSDFMRFGVKIWDEVKTRDRRNEQRLKLIEELNDWRNAIAHESFDPSRSRGLALAKVRSWRSACASLVQAFDETMAEALYQIVGARPW